MFEFVETAPAAPPVDLATAKEFAQVEITDTDTLITSLVLAATSYVEHVTGRALVSRACTMKLDQFPWRFLCMNRNVWHKHALKLYKPPVASVDSVTYLDQTGTLQTLDPSLYQFTQDGRFGVVRDHAFPMAEWQTFNAVTINYTAGYGDATAVPDAIKTAILFLVRHWHDNRLPVADVLMSKIPLTVDALLAPYMVHQYN